MQSWQIGNVKITRVVESEIPVPYHQPAPLIREATPAALREIPWLYPHFVTPEGYLMTSVHALLVEASGLRIVVDTCIGNDKPRRMTRMRPLQSKFLEKFQQAGWSRESVDLVVCTHLHVDHVGWNTMRENDRWVPTFPNAQYLIGRREYEHWRDDRSDKQNDDEQQATLADSIQPIFDAGLARFVEMDHVVCDEIRLQPTPGHTPGHVSVMIESQGQRAIITGDIVHHPCQIAHPQWSVPFDSDRDAAAAMREDLFASWADQPALVIGTHFATPTAGRIKRDGDTYRFEV